MFRLSPAIPLVQARTEAGIGQPMNLVFENPLELIAIAGVSFTVNAIAAEGETTWFEGVLGATYFVLAMAFFLVPAVTAPLGK